MKSPNNIHDSNFNLAESSMDKFRYKNDQIFTSNMNIDQMIAQESLRSDIYEDDQRRAEDNASDSWPWMDPTMEFAWRKIFFFFPFSSRSFEGNLKLPLEKQRKEENEYSEERSKLNASFIVRFIYSKTIYSVEFCDKIFPMEF